MTDDLRAAGHTPMPPAGGDLRITYRASEVIALGNRRYDEGWTAALAAAPPRPELEGDERTRGTLGGIVVAARAVRLATDGSHTTMTTHDHERCVTEALADLRTALDAYAAATEPNADPDDPYVADVP